MGAIFGADRAVSRPGGLPPVRLSFQSKLDPQPLSRVEEAYLIAATGVTGLPYWDNPTKAPTESRSSALPAWKDRDAPPAAPTTPGPRSSSCGTTKAPTC